MATYGVQWQQWNAKNQLVCKERFFKTANARDKFMAKIEQDGNFRMFLATLDEE